MSDNSDSSSVEGDDVLQEEEDVEMVDYDEEIEKVRKEVS